MEAVRRTGITSCGKVEIKKQGAKEFWLCACSPAPHFFPVSKAPVAVAVLTAGRVVRQCGDTDSGRWSTDNRDGVVGPPAPVALVKAPG